MGRKKIKPHITEELLGGNPLTKTDFKILVKHRLKRYKSGTGANVDVEFELEYDRYVKVYVDSDKRKAMASLGSAAKCLFMWLIYELESGKDYIWINRDRYMDEMNISALNTYRTAVSELVRGNLIALSLIRDVYFINPRLFFNGSRIAKYPDNVEEYKSKKQNDKSV